MLTAKMNAPRDCVSGLLLGLALLMVLSAQAANRYVSTNGNDTTGDGTTPGTAWFSLTNAMTHIGNYDTVYVGAGIFTEGAGFGVTVITNCTIVGAGPNLTIVQPTNAYGTAGAPGSAGRVFTVSAATNVTFQNMTIRYGRIISTSQSGAGIGVTAAAASLVISNCVVTSNLIPFRL